MSNAHVRRDIYMEIYNDCYFAVSPLWGHDELHFALSGPCKGDGVSLVFERPVLERFLKLAREALKLQLPENTSITPPKLVSLSAD
jgi:hypothetical protein